MKSVTFGQQMRRPRLAQMRHAQQSSRRINAPRLRRKRLARLSIKDIFKQ
jgi:hypothetical protein